MKRRTFIQHSSLTALSISTIGSIEWNGKIFVGNSPTTTDILGPFYRPGAPMRSNLILPNSAGTPVILKGTILKEDGKTPISNALIEIWHCDEKEVYDNTSDEYRYRASQKSKKDGKYQFKTILPVPYKADPDEESSWRPAHIHMRVSVPYQLDLITQIYFENGKYVESDPWASDPKAENRILKISKNTAGENEINFNIVLSNEIPLDVKVYDKITGLYDMGKNNFVEFIKDDDSLFLKRNGALSANLRYIGNNTFEGGGTGYPKVNFEMNADGSVKATITFNTNTYSGVKYLKYK